MAIVKVIYSPEIGFNQFSSNEPGVVVNGNFTTTTLTTNLMYFPCVTKITDYTLGNESIVFGDCSNGSITFTLPDANLYNLVNFKIKKIDTTSNNLNLQGSSGQTIDGVSSISISIANTSVDVFASGSNWYII